MENFAVRDLREHTGELVRNAEQGQFSVVSKHSKPLFIAMPFGENVVKSGVTVALADRLVSAGELSLASGAKLAGLSYENYLKHLSALGYSLLDPAANLARELATLTPAAGDT